MKVIYDGPNPSVEVHVGDGVYVGAERGKPVDLPAKIAEGLVAGGWKKAAAKPEPKSDPGAEKESN